VGTFDDAGHTIAHREGLYPMHSPGAGLYEQNPEEWEGALLRCLRSLGSHRRRAAIVSITGQGSTSVCLDSRGRVIGPVISHLDTRSLGEGSPVPSSMGYVASKMAAPLLWLRRERPGDFGRVSLVMDVREYVGYLLTGSVTHDSSAFPKGLGKFEDLTGLKEGAMGEPHDTTSPIGSVRREFSAKSGLPEGTPVIVAPFDGLCSVVGAGVDRKGLFADIAGSTEVISTPVEPGSQHEVLPRALDGLSLFYASPPLGWLFQWFRDQFYGSPKGSFARIDKDASRAAPGSSGVICLPRITYEGYSARSSLSLHNLSSSSGRPEMARAVMEGLAFYVFSTITMLSSSGLRIDEVRLGGGGASSRLWNQIRADTYGIEVAVPQTLSVGCLGSAIYGSVAAGLHSSIPAAVARMVRVAQRYSARPLIHKEYSRIFENFLALSKGE
jgi:sugar (pentulose or hexulose) kinase